MVRKGELIDFQTPLDVALEPLLQAVDLVEYSNNDPLRVLVW